MEDIVVDGSGTFDHRSQLYIFNYDSVKTHAHREEEVRMAWEAIRFQVLQAFAIKSEECAVPGHMCVSGCLKSDGIANESATHVCLTCSEIGIPSSMCISCAENHLSRSGLFCHKVVDSAGMPFMAQSTQVISCCTAEKSHCHEVHLYSGSWNEKADVRHCENHTYAEALIGSGFFPASPTKPDYAFRFDVLRTALLARQHIGGSSYNSVFKALLLRQHPTVRLNSSTMYRKIYRPFARALREFSVVKHLISHCRLTKEIQEKHGVGFTQCPCLGATDCNSPFRLMYDGLSSARKISEKKGGGSDISKPVLEPSSFWPPLQADVVQESKKGKEKEKTTSPVVISDTCSSSFHAGKETDGDPRCSVNGICAGFCVHQLALFSWDMVKGEKLVYVDSAIAEVKRLRPGRLLDLFYDIVCREDVHREAHNLNDKYNLDLGHLPVLHAFCHGLSCQLLYGSLAGMGSGTFGGETHERGWSTVIKFIAPTMYETSGHRRDSLLVIFEARNQDRLETLLPSVAKQLENLLAEILDKLPQGTYDEVLDNNFLDRKRRLEVSKLTSSAVSQATTAAVQALNSQDIQLASKQETLLNSATDIARTIRLRDRLIGRKKGAGGTSIVSSLRRANKQDAKKLEAIIGVYNDLTVFNVPDVSALVSENINGEESEESEDDDGGFVEEELVSSSVASDRLTFKSVFESITVAAGVVDSETTAWKLIEDLFWIKNDLEAMVGYYTERKNTFWMDLLETLGKDDSLSSMFRSTALHIISKRINAEDLMLEEVKGILETLESDYVKAVMEKLKEVERAWKENRHVEIFNNLRIIAGVSKGVSESISQ
ncbi:hypothetical protein BDR26DRAFT_849549 [Obelidium mucronatum]|nr:hypothetical protein BDR26DRAFT_849549 [Obelidium mucronatum]